MNDSSTAVLVGIAAIHLGFLYIFSAVFQWAWFYEGRGWSPYDVIGHDMTIVLFKAFGGFCYCCGFLFVAVSLVERGMWAALAGLVAHSLAMAGAGWVQSRRPA